MFLQVMKDATYSSHRYRAWDESSRKTALGKFAKKIVGLSIHRQMPMLLEISGIK